MEMAGPPPLMEIKLTRRRKKIYAKNAEKRKNARNLVIFWTTGKGKYSILLEISCQ